MNHLLKLGTCSWKYDSWKGLVYDQDKKYRASDYLYDYAKVYNSVEVDQWFWSLFPGGVKLPDPAAVKQYADLTPDNFSFSVKAPNALTLTHYYAKQPKKYQKFSNQPNDLFFDGDLLNRFLETLSPFGEKLGPVMFQFEYLNKQKMPSLNAFLDRFHEFLTQAPKGFQYGLETRNPNFLKPALFDFLREHNTGFVFLEGYYMPHIGEIFQRFDTLTGDFSVVRLHGGDRKEIEKQTGEVWNRIVAPKDQGIHVAAQIVKRHMEAAKRIYVNANNHYEGSAPLTLDKLVKKLDP